MPSPFRVFKTPGSFIAAERASIKRASEEADLICVYGENLSQTIVYPQCIVVVRDWKCAINFLSVLFQQHNFE